VISSTTTVVVVVFGLAVLGLLGLLRDRGRGVVLGAVGSGRVLLVRLLLRLLGVAGVHGCSEERRGRERGLRDERGAEDAAGDGLAAADHDAGGLDGQVPAGAGGDVLQRAVAVRRASRR
jgi:hypothetical protein